MTSAQRIAQALDGRRSGDGYLVRCPAPGHGKGNGDRNGSLLIKDGDRALLVKCFAGCPPTEVLDALRRRGLLNGEQPSQPHQRPSVERAPDHTPSPKALEIWGASAKLKEGSIPARYLRARGITLPLPPSLRSSEAPYLDRYVLPALVAAVQAPDRRTIAVHTTFVDLRGDRKAQVRMPRKTTGALGYGAVRLAAAGPALGLAEGVETGLSAIQLFGVPVWCSLSACRMQRVWIPDDVRELHIFADNDEAGRAAAERTAHTHRNRRIVVRTPPTGDWNDVLIAGGGSKE